METIHQPTYTFARIVDKLRYMDEAELKLAYMKLFKKELEEEWKRVIANSDFSDVSDEEIVAAIKTPRVFETFAV